MDMHLKKLSNYVMRDQKIPLEIRLFRLISLTVAILCIFLILPVNMLQDLSPYLNVSVACYGLMAAIIYYCSCNSHQYIKSLYALTVILLNITWFLNGGSTGSISYFFFAAVLYPLIFFRGLTRQLTFLLFILDNCALLMVEHYYPSVVTPFKSANDRLIDLSSGFAFSAIASALVFWVVVTTLEHELDERKCAEQALKENENTLRTLMDSMPSGIWWFNEDESIEYVNNCFTEMFGYTREDVPTLQDWFRSVYPEDNYRIPYLAARNISIDEARRNNTAVPLREARITCKDGSTRHIIINTQFALGRTIEIFTDITERELAQNQMLKVQKLESLGVLAGGIAHDFNNILTSVIGNISFADILVGSEHQAHARLLQAEKAALRATELAKQLLTFSKGGQPVKMSVNIRHLLNESMSLSIRGSNVQGIISVSSDLHTVEADEGQLSQAFNNIIINATHAMPHGGRLTIDAENIFLKEVNPWHLPSGDYIRVTFSDEGIGISENDQKSIFDPYFTTKASGTGLGLASTYSIITKHGGHISVHSSLGMGAVFTIYLPAMEGMVAEEAGPGKELVSASPDKESILIMDDEEMICELTATMLAQFGYQVQTCCNGDEAISHYRAAQEKNTPFAAVILDLTIPGGMGGKEAVQHLLALDTDARLIVSSGYSNDLAAAEWSKFGFSGFLAKPYAAPDLLQVLSDVINGQK